MQTSENRLKRKSKFYREYKKDPKQNSSSSNQENYLKDENCRQIKKILCVYHKNNTQIKSIGISYVEQNETTNSTTIFTGDYSTFLLDSFELFLTNLQPDIILIHSADNPKLNEIFKFFENKVRFLHNTIINYNEISEVLRMYYKSLFYDQNEAIKINSKISLILSNLTESAILALYNILVIVLKHQSTYNFQEEILFEKIQFDEILFVSKKTQQEIRIFEEKLHPSMVKGKGKSKEGVSLFNIFNKCVTTQGKKLMKNIFQFPLVNYEKLKLRKELIHDFSYLKNNLLIKFILVELRGVKELEKCLNELKKFMINFKIWNSIFLTIESVIQILEIFQKEVFNNKSSGKFKLLLNIYNRINLENIIKVYDFITNCLDIMKDQIKPKIKVGINEDLDNLRQEYNSLHEILSKHALSYSANIPKNTFIDKFLYVFLPQLGYMFAIEKTEKYFTFLKKVNSLIENLGANRIDEEQIYNIDGLNISLKSIEDESNKYLEESNNKEKQDEINIDSLSNYAANYQNNVKFNRHNEVIEEEDENLEDKVTQNENIIKSQQSKEDEDYLPELTNSEETFILHQIIFRDLNITFQFHSDEMIYFKNETSNKLDNEYGDLSARITDIENAIFREISKQILEFEKDILIADEFIANLDCFLHFFVLSEKLELSPSSTISNDLEVEKTKMTFKEGRNLLSELLAERRYIKNSFNCNNKNIFIISGNNSSGKSTFLRQMGAMVYLNQIGSFIPAKEFESLLFTKILTNIEIHESTLDHLSGFTLELKELKNIVDMVNKNIENEKTLIILDDPFKRTSIHNKNCLLGGLISHFNNLVNNHDNKNVKVFISTSIDSKNFLIENNIIDSNISSIYEMKTEILIKKEFVNLFELKEMNATILTLDNKKYTNLNLFQARDNGLDNTTFLKSIEISNLIHSERSIQPDFSKIIRIIQNLKANRNYFKTINNDFSVEEVLEILNQVCQVKINFN